VEDDAADIIRQMRKCGCAMWRMTWQVFSVRPDMAVAAMAASAAGGNNVRVHPEREIFDDESSDGGASRVHTTSFLYLSVLYFMSYNQTPAVNPPFRPPEGAQLKRPRRDPSDIILPFPV
jgi:hypothetical protein